MRKKLLLLALLLFFCSFAAGSGGVSADATAVKGAGSEIADSLISLYLPELPAVTAAETTEAVSQPRGCEYPANGQDSGSSLSLRDPSELTEEDVRSLTIAPTSSFGYDCCGDVLVYNGTSYSEDIASLLEQAPVLTADGGPSVLIYHTHACEAYTPSALDSYSTSGEDRSDNELYNVVRVGAELADRLAEYGIEAVHDTTLYDVPSYAGAYARSEAGVEAWLREYPGIQIVLDIHRDALNEAGTTKYKLCSEYEGESCAQLMLLVGTDEASGAHPFWRENYRLALHLQRELLSLSGTIARPIKLTRSSYNQFVSPGALIVEIGANGNTLSEAMRTADALAEAIASLFGQ